MSKSDPQLGRNTSRSAKNTTGMPRDVPDDVARKLDAAYDVDAFERALRRVTRRLDRPDAPPDPGSSKTGA